MLFLSGLGAVTPSEMLGQAGLDVTTGGDAAWTFEPAFQRDTDYMAVSGTIDHSQQSTMEVTATGPGTVKFRWKVSSEAGGDMLRFSVDGVDDGSPISGGVDWVQKTLTIGSGSHALRWTYAKNASATSRRDRAWVASLEIPVHGAPSIIRQPADLEVFSGENAAFRVAADGGGLSYQWYEGESGDLTRPISGATGPMLLTGPAGSASSYWVRIQNTSGTINSVAAALTVDTTSGALFGSGTVSTYYPMNPQPSGVVGSASGNSHYFFIKENGEMWGFGSNQYGQLGDGTQTDRSRVQLATGIKQAAAGESHSLFLQSNDVLKSMGSNSRGQLGDGSTTMRLTPVEIAQDVMWVTAGSYHSLFIRNDHTLWAMGRNDYGQLGDGSLADRSTPVMIASDVVHAEAGGFFSVFLKADGSLWGMGSNQYGRQPNQPGDNPALPQCIAQGITVTAAGLNHGLYVNESGDLWAVGSNDSSQLGDGTTTYQSESLIVASNTRSVSAGGAHSLFVTKDFTLWGMGSNSNGQLRTGGSYPGRVPILLQNGIRSTSAGSWSSLWIDLGPSIVTHPTQGDAPLNGTTTLSVAAAGPGSLSYQWFEGESGDTSHPIAGATAASFETPPVTATTRFWVRVSNKYQGVDSNSAEVILVLPPVITVEPHPPLVENDEYPSLEVTATGGILAYQWFEGETGNTDKPVSGATGSFFLPSPIRTETRFWVRISNYDGIAESASVVVNPPIRVGGRLVMFGTPGLLPNVTDLTAAATGVMSAFTRGNHLLFVKDDGSLWGAGANDVGQLGDGTTTPRQAPVLVSNGVIEASVGDNHSLFLKNDGTLWAMGQNHYGQIGNGMTDNSVVIPLQIATNVVQLSACVNHSIFLKADGTVWGMGQGGYEVFGKSITQSLLSPVLLAGNVSRISTNEYDTLVVLRDGTVRDLDSYSSGQPDSSVPLASRIVAVDTGRTHALLINSEATLFALESNLGGRLGNGTTIERTFPVQVASGVSRVAAGNEHSLFIKSDRTLWGRGSTWLGQFGFQSDINQLIPLKLRDAIGFASAGIYTSLFVDLTPQIQSQPQDQVSLAGTSVTFTVTAVGPGGLTYQWYRGESGTTTDPISGADESVFETGTVTETARYWVRVSNAYASVDSESAEALLVEAPEIEAPPTAGPIRRDGTAWFEVRASGNQLTYQWYAGASGDESIPVPGATGPFLVVSRRFGHTTYWVKISNALGTVASNPADARFLDFQPLMLRGMGRNNEYQLGEIGVPSTFPPDQLLPVDLQDGVISCTSGYRHSLFVKQDGGLWAVGGNQSGQIGDGTTLTRKTPFKVADGVACAAAGNLHSLFVKNDGSLWGMGENLEGQLGDGTRNKRLLPVPIATGVIEAWTRENFSLYLKSDGSLWGMGANTGSQFGAGLGSAVLSPILIAQGIAKATAGVSHLLFLRTDGSLWGMGGNASGQLGDGTTATRTTPSFVSPKVVGISAGRVHSLFVKSDGGLWTMGTHGLSNAPGQPSIDPKIPYLVTTGVLEAAAGGAHSHFLKQNRSLWSFGSNADGQLGDGTTTYRGTPVNIATGAAAVAGGNDHTLFLDLKSIPRVVAAEVDTSFGGTPTISVIAPSTSPVVFQWYQGMQGDVSNPVTGATTPHLVTAPVFGEAHYWLRATYDYGSADSATVRVFPIDPPILTQHPPSRNIIGGNGTSFSVTATGNLLRFQWYMGLAGDISHPIEGALTRLLVTPKIFETTSFWCRVRNGAGSVDSTTASIIVQPGITLRLHAMGLNSDGQLGDGTTTTRSSPVVVDPACVGFSAGVYHSLVIRTDGSLWAFGRNTAGQLGDGTLLSRSTPVRVAEDVRLCSAGSSHSLFIKNDGTLWAMGNNTYGAYGNGTSTRSLVPIQVATDVTDCVAGENMSAFIKNDGSLWTTGFNDIGQLGTGDTMNRNVPQKVTGGVARISSLRSGSLYLLNNGTLMGMGRASGGRLGRATTLVGIPFGVSVPVLVASDVIGMDAGYLHTQFITSDGTAWGLGANAAGQIGNTASSSWLDPALSLASATDVEAGPNSSFFIRPDKTLWACGENTSGQLGIGSTVNQLTPLQVASSVGAVSAGSYHTLFSDLLPVILAEPQDQVIRAGSTAVLSVSTGGPAPISYQWYQGASGNTSIPVDNAGLPTLQIQNLSETTMLWVRITNSHGTTDSRSAMVTVVKGSAAYFAWADATGLTGLDLLQDSDPDRDNLPTLLEFALGRDPKTADHGMPLDFILTPGSNQPDMLLTLPEPDPSLELTVVISEDLQQWTPIRLEFTGTGWILSDPSVQLVSAIPGPNEVWNLRLRTREASVRFLKIGACMPVDPPEG